SQFLARGSQATSTCQRPSGSGAEYCGVAQGGTQIDFIGKSFLLLSPLDCRAGRSGGLPGEELQRSCEKLRSQAGAWDRERKSSIVPSCLSSAWARPAAKLCFVLDSAQKRLRVRSSLSIPCSPAQS